MKRILLFVFMIILTKSFLMTIAIIHMKLKMQDIIVYHLKLIKIEKLLKLERNPDNS